MCVSGRCPPNSKSRAFKRSKKNILFLVRLFLVFPCFQIYRISPKNGVEKNLSFIFFFESKLSFSLFIEVPQKAGSPKTLDFEFQLPPRCKTFFCRPMLQTVFMWVHEVMANGSLSNGNLSNGNLSNGNLSNGNLSNGILLNGILSNSYSSIGNLSNSNLSNGSLLNGNLSYGN